MHATLLCLQGEYSVGVITQAVEQVAAQGVAYFGAAGNYDGAVWEATPANWITVDNRTLHNFGTAAAPSTFLEVYLFGRTRFYLHVRGWGNVALLMVMVMTMMICIAMQHSKPVMIVMRLTSRNRSPGIKLLLA
jgi:hypothetical protein